MPHFIVRHKVEDFARWKPIFDAHSATRQASGSRGGLLFRNADNPSELIIVWDWESLDQARQFAQSADLRDKMQAAGVADRPDIYFLEEIESVPV